eukprot:1211803-Rhodomonas_salina.1
MLSVLEALGVQEVPALSLEQACAVCLSVELAGLAYGGVPGTELAYGDTAWWGHAGTELAYRTELACSGAVRYADSGTEPAYGAAKVRY